MLLFLGQRAQTHSHIQTKAAPALLLKRPKLHFTSILITEIVFSYRHMHKELRSWMTYRKKSKLSLKKQRLVGICNDERQSRKQKQQRRPAAVGDAGKDQIRLCCLDISKGLQRGLDEDAGPARNGVE